MVVQQGELSPTDTTKDMANYYSDAVVSEVSDVDRGIHNATQFIRLALQQPQPQTANRFTTSGSLTVDTPEYIDGTTVPFTTLGTTKMTIGFGVTLVKTTTIVLFSKLSIDDTTSKWTVATSLNNLESEFTDSNFEAAITSVTPAIISPNPDDLLNNHFRYTIVVTAPPIDTTNVGLPNWRISHSDDGAFNTVQEVQIIDPRDPTITVFNSDGTFNSSFTFDEANILDAVFDNINGVFYTIRFNDQNVGTSTITVDDDFSDADAGTASGTTKFNPGRWDESTTDTAFLRTGDALAYSVAAGNGQLETTYTLADFSASIDFNPISVTSEKMWLALRALDVDNKTLVQEGIGFETSPTTSGVRFAHAIENFVNTTADSTLTEVRPLWHNSVSGTDTFAIVFDGNIWTVSGTQTGALADAQTGVPYDEAVASTTPIEFLISSTATPTNGEQFTFDLNTDNDKIAPTVTGIISVSRTGSDFITGTVFTTPKTINSNAVSIELFGNTDGTVNISADNFNVTGSGNFPDVSVFTVQRTDNEGKLVSGNPTVIDSLDIIGDPSKTYNSFLDGKVQITATQSGTGGGHVYIKVDNKLFKYPNSVSLTASEDGSSATQTSEAQVAIAGTHSLAWTRRSTTDGFPFLTYHEYDSDLDIIHLRTLDKDTLQDTTNTKEALLNQSGYTTISNFKVFYDQNDFDTLYYVDSSANLQSFNLDDRISAFIAVNAEDVTIAAGTSTTTDGMDDVINCWGEVLAGKVVTFAVTAGDGAVTPATDTTDGAGGATTVFSVGATVGVSTVTATVTEA